MKGLLGYYFNSPEVTSHKFQIYLYLLIYILLKDDTSNSGHIASNDGMSGAKIK
jgi:hypothetical protein